MKKRNRQKVEDWIDAHEEKIVSDVKRLVSIASVAELESRVHPYGQKCREVMEEYCRIAEEHGYRITSYDDRVVRADTTDVGSRPDIGIWNHLDVVPAGHDWKFQPYEPVLKEGYLIGRGVKDNKGPAVAAIYAIQCLKDLGAPLKHAISLYAGMEEEKGMSDILWLKANQVEFPRVNIVLDSRYPVCYGEKGILNVSVARRKKLPANIIDIDGGESVNSVAGRARMKLLVDAPVKLPDSLPEWIRLSCTDDGRLIIEARGLSKHAAHPEGSENAVFRLFAAVGGKEPFCEELHEILAGTVDPDTLEMFRRYASLSEGIYGEGLGISAEDGISGKLTAVATLLSFKERLCSVTYDIRYPISLKMDCGLIEKIEAKTKNFGMEVTKVSGKQPGYFPKDHPLIENLMNTYNEFMGSHEKPFTIAGGTYARMLPNAFGYGFRIVPEPDYPETLIPPGHGNSHSADEAVSIEHFKRQLALLAVSLAEAQVVELS